MEFVDSVDSTRDVGDIGRILAVAASDGTDVALVVIFTLVETVRRVSCRWMVRPFYDCWWTSLAVVPNLGGYSVYRLWLLWKVEALV